jgi:hypothetical protein
VSVLPARLHRKPSALAVPVPLLLEQRRQGRRGEQAEGLRQHRNGACSVPLRPALGTLGQWLPTGMEDGKAAQAGGCQDLPSEGDKRPYFLLLSEWRGAHTWPRTC